MTVKMAFVIPGEARNLLFPATKQNAVSSKLLAGSFQCQPERIQRQRPQQIPPHPTLDLSDPLRSRSDPVEISGLRHLRKLTLNVGVVNQLRRDRLQKHQVAQQRVERTEKLF